ncbi:MAG: thiosulfate oxidation carrier protein SoxY [Burkholderiales bacterium]|jgi:sulfur-oxidizing protein SoxY|nr:thiosulfate oxidation carrier protein SoxY [Burkholderiales bacterium]
MKDLRRNFLKLAGGAGAMAVTVAAGLLKPGSAWAAPWNKTAFESKASADAIKNLGAAELVESKDITITAPDIAENGAIVPVAVTSKIPNTQNISIIAEKNPFPLAASFDISAGGDAYVSTRVKMGQTSDVRAVVKAGGKFYTAVKEVKVTVGGCG